MYIYLGQCVHPFSGDEYDALHFSTYCICTMYMHNLQTSCVLQVKQMATFLIKVKEVTIMTFPLRRVMAIPLGAEDLHVLQFQKEGGGSLYVYIYIYIYICICTYVDVYYQWASLKTGLKVPDGT